MNALPLLRVLLGACAPLLMTGTVQACNALSFGGGHVDLSIDTWDDGVGDVQVSTWAMAGNANFLEDCDRWSNVAVDVIPAVRNLQYERDVTIDGDRYPAFGIVGWPRSPLLIFRYAYGSGSGDSTGAPFDVRSTLNSSGAGVTGYFRWSVVSVAAVSRGGAMEEVPTTDLGSIRHIYPPNPSLTKLESFSVSATLRTKTCTLANATVVLDDAYVLDLPTAGSSSGQRDFNVVMRCNGRYPVSLVLTDANGPGNTGSRLTPTSNATATGVRVELLREDTPVVLGQRWMLAESQNGSQNIALAARYYREAGAFGAGVVEGQAIITATYR
ncbi:MAG: type 1 fimbrial protein [Stenotrophomonas maltophilia]|uniref:fimbrial protein n=1 Tax=Stenotrophomonas TaxID=40323 RepID=UPI0013114E3B|nr:MULTISPECIES: fimbrial protein [Stenotrophomonas]MBS4803177.1 type 1 fimbrial protein [Stenotrophomonas maltophilia]MDG9988095.1 fimbrial protein [Stenotrophomonas sp. GD04024]